MIGVRVPVALAAALLAVGTAAEARAEGGEGRPADLVQLLEPTPLGRALDRARIKPFGWVEGMISTSPITDSGTRTGRVFDVEDEGLRLHQAYFAVERSPAEDRSFDVGGKIAAHYGTDARFLHARGLLDNQGDDEEQFDLLEIHASARFAILEGLTVKVGKFVTTLGFEVVPAPDNLLPSRSLLYGFAIPFTHTGMLATLKLSDDWCLTYGLVFGWDVWVDNNDALSHIAGFMWSSPLGGDSVTMNVITGAERADDDHDLRTVLDATWAYEWSDRFKTALNADYGFEQGASPSGGTARWWGVAGYATGKLSDRLSATLRAEWFRDEDGTRLGSEASLGELTLGLDWTPFPCFQNLRVRPEIRWDHSFGGRFFDGGTDRDQWSAALDLLFTF